MGTQVFGAWVHFIQGCLGARLHSARARGHPGQARQPPRPPAEQGGGAHLSPLSPRRRRRQHSNAEFASVAALLAHYSGAPGGCFCRLAPGRRNPGYEERDPGGGASAWGEAAWAPAAPVGVQHERG